MTSILSAKPREILGKKVRGLRKAGFLPAVLYGEGVSAQAISVPYKEFEKAYREAGESTLIKLQITDDKLQTAKEYNVLIHDITHNPIKGTIVHTDFLAVRMDKEIRTKISLVFMGESSAIKNEGAILLKVMQEIEIEALPQNLPHGIKVDISLLSAIGAKITVGDLKFPSGVKILAHADEVVAIAEPPRSDEDLEALQEKPVAEIKEVSTEQEIKRAEAVVKDKEVPGDKK